MAKKIAEKNEATIRSNNNAASFLDMAVNLSYSHGLWSFAAHYSLIRASRQSPACLNNKAKTVPRLADAQGSIDVNPCRLIAFTGLSYLKEAEGEVELCGGSKQFNSIYGGA